TDDLAFTRAECAALAHRYPSAVRLRGKAVTREDVLRHAAQSELLHYSGHAFFHPAQPLQSGLVLEGKGEVFQHRWLTLADLFTRLHMPNNRLTVISGCESGLVEMGVIDEYIGLPSGFLYAGAPCVLSTLWPVADLSSALLMDRFHEEWAGGRRSVAAALHAAQRWLRDEISIGSRLLEVLPGFLAHLPDPAQRDLCSERAEQLAAACPNEHPFASPHFWAP